MKTTKQKYRNLLTLILIFSVSITFAQVGINTTDPKSTLDVNGALSLREGPALTLTDGFNNNISLGTEPYSFYRITGPTDSFTISGFIPSANADGQIIVIQNTTDEIMTIAHNNNASNGARRIFVPGEKDFIVTGQFSTITLQYNGFQNRWLLLNKLNHIETGYVSLGSIFTGLNVYTVSIPDITAGSSISVNLLGPVPSSIAANLVIENVESQNGNAVFRIRNYGGDITGGAVVILINKI